ncbi:MAG: HEAT repeat domain-containing protein [Phycisphaeraceae bacterium]
MHTFCPPVAVRRAGGSLLGVLALTLAIGCQSSPGRPVDDASWFADLLPQFATAPSPSEAARDAFNVYSPDRRREAVDYLATAPFGGEPVYVRMYRLLIDDPDASVRASCAKALGLHGTAEDATAIIPLLRDDAAFVRWEAAKALQRLHNPDAAQPLATLLQDDEDADVRMEAATALGQYPSSAVFQTLVGALHDTDYGVARAARQSLRTLTGQDHGPEAGDWLAWADEQRSSEAMFAGRQTYTYQPWSPPAGVLRRMQFWRDADPDAEPQTPAGLEQPERG